MNTEKKIVLLDSKGQDISKQEFPFEQAANIFAFQKAQQRNDWTLSEGQNYDLNDGILTERANTDNSSRRNKQAGRTEQLS